MLKVTQTAPKNPKSQAQKQSSTPGPTTKARLAPIVGSALSCSLAVLICGCAPDTDRDRKGRLPPPPAEVASSPLGWSPASFSVDTAGAAHYTIPIEVPPGRVGLEPQLSLIYNSQAGDGTLGIGWALSGLSMIERTGRDLRYDEELHAVRFDNSDAFVLDGEHIVPVDGENGADGTVYRTKIDQFSKIVSHGTGPDYFTVYTKDGLILSYGDTLPVSAQSSSVFVAFSGRPMAWALSEIRDRSRNYLRVRYLNERMVPPPSDLPVKPGLGVYREDTPSLEDPTLEMVPAGITYTGNDLGRDPKRWVEFIYDERPDPSYGYTAGIRIQDTQRLREIQVGVTHTGTLGSDGIERSYEFCYSNDPVCHDRADPQQRSMLTTVTEKDKHGVAKKPTRFQWQNGSISFEQHAALSRDTLGFSGTRVDVNNDGVADVLYGAGSRDDGGVTDCRVYLKLGAVDDDPVDLLLGQPETELGSCADRYGTVPLDYNNDGFLDLLKLPGASSLDEWQVLINTGTGGAPYFEAATDTNLSGRYGNNAYFHDLNGDGLPDFIHKYTERNWPTVNLSYRLHTGNGFSANQHLDSDLLGWHTSRTVVPIFLDYNGDGATDLLVRKHPSSSTPNEAEYTAISFANDTISVEMTDLPVFDMGEETEADVRVEIFTTDINGDGLQDILKMEHDQYGLCLADGRLWVNTGSQIPHFLGGHEGFPVFRGSLELARRCYQVKDSSDFNQDGRHDLLVLRIEGRVDRDYDAQWALFLAGADEETLGAYTSVVEISDFQSDYLPYPVPPRPRIVDINGDYLPDILAEEGVEGDGTGWWYTARVNRVLPPLITHIQDGRILDDETWSVVIDFRPAADATVCTTQPHELVADVVAPRLERMYSHKPESYLVSSYSFDNGPDNPRLTYGLSYHDPRADQHWGGLGFGQIVQTAEHTGQSTVSVYDNHNRQPGVGFPDGYYPYQGLVKRREVEFPLENGESYTSSMERFHSVRAVSGLTVFPYARGGSDEAVWHSESGAKTTMSRSTWSLLPGPAGGWAMDDYGNVQGYERIFGPEAGLGSHRIEVRRDYRNDPDTWLIGLPEFRKIRFEPPSAPATIQESSYDYRPGTRLLSRFERAPSNVLYKQVHNFTYYDDDGNLESKSISATTDEGVETHELFTLFYETDEHIFVDEIRNGLGHSNRFVNDAMGRVVIAEDQNGLLTSYQYDGFGRLAVIDDLQTDDAVVHSLGIELIGDQQHLATSSMGTDGQVQKIILDRAHRPLLIGHKDFEGNLIYQRYGYDHLGKIGRTYAPQLVSVDELGTHYLEYQYDNLGRVVSITGTDGSSESTDYSGLQAEVTTKAKEADTESGEEPTYHTTISSYDRLGRLKEVEDARGGNWQYRYGELGLLREVLDPNEKSYTFEYDDYGRLRGMSHPSVGTTTYVYDAFDYLNRTTDARGCETRARYDILGRREWQESSGENCCGGAGCVERMDYEYDDPSVNAIGKLNRSRSSPWGHETDYAYDDIGRLATKTQTIAGEPFRQGFEYDALGRLKVHRYPSFFYTSYGPGADEPKAGGYKPGGGGRLPRSVVEPFDVYYRYNDQGYLEAVSNYESDAPLAPGITPIDYWLVGEADAMGRPTRVHYGNDVETTMGYDPLRGRLLTMESDVQALTYSYNVDGTMEFRQDHNQQRREVFTYDDLRRLTVSRLVEVEDDGAMRDIDSTSYTYDAIGNLRYRSDLGLLTYDELSARPYWVRTVETTDGEIEPYGHDENGNMLTRPREEIAFTSFNKPKAISDSIDAETVLLDYDGHMERARKRRADSTTIYADAYRRITDVDGITHRYHVGNLVVDRKPGDVGYSEETRYLHFDHLGSPNVLTDETGEVQGHLYFDPFGHGREAPWGGGQVEVGDLGIMTGFTGHEHDEDWGMDLINMGGREYDPRLGRFLSPDPVIQFPKVGQSYSSYSYALNNPMGFIDPSGYFLEAVIGLFQRLFGGSGGTGGSGGSDGGVGEPGTWEPFEGGGWGNQDGPSRPGDGWSSIGGGSEDSGGGSHVSQPATPRAVGRSASMSSSAVARPVRPSLKLRGGGLRDTSAKPPPKLSGDLVTDPNLSPHSYALERQEAFIRRNVTTERRLIQSTPADQPREMSDVRLCRVRGQQFTRAFERSMENRDIARTAKTAVGAYYWGSVGWAGGELFYGLAGATKATGMSFSISGDAARHLGTTRTILASGTRATLVPRRIATSTRVSVDAAQTVFGALLGAGMPTYRTSGEVSLMYNDVPVCSCAGGVLQPPNAFGLTHESSPKVGSPYRMSDFYLYSE